MDCCFEWKRNHKKMKFSFLFFPIETRRKNRMFDRDVLQRIRRFLRNRELIETLCVCRSWGVLLHQSLFTEFKVSHQEDLMNMIRRYLRHRQTICRTVLVGMDLSEWPFQSPEMILVACRGTMSSSSCPPVVRTFRYQHQYESFVQKDQFDQYVDSLRNMERLSITTECEEASL